MSMREWVDSAIRLIDVLVAWPVFAAVMLVVFREQVGEGFRWLGKLVEKREVSASTPIGSITLKRLSKAEVVRVVKDAVGQGSATRAEVSGVERIAAAGERMIDEIRTGEDAALREVSGARGFRLTFGEDVPDVVVAASGEVARALVVLRFGATDGLSGEHGEWVEAAERLAKERGGSGGAPFTRLQFELIGEAVGLAAV